MKNDSFTFSVDRDARAIRVSRRFAAPQAMVWSAWTEADLLERWWGHAPYPAETKEMDFREGGRWLYAMVGPDGAVGRYSRTAFLSITPRSEFRTHTAFCDAEGVVAPDWPGSNWQVRFTPEDDETRVDIEIRYTDLSILETIIDLGFREGFTRGLQQLADLLAER